MTSIPRVQLQDLLPLCESGLFEVCRIDPIWFSPQLLDDMLSAVLYRYPLITKDGYESYKSICLQHREGAENPLYDDVEQRQGVVVGGTLRKGVPARGFCDRRTVVGEHFSFLWDTPLSDHVVLLRGRIMQALPGFEMNWHNDGLDNRRIHIPIRTNPECLLEYQSGNSYHMPADGSIYVVNASGEHRAVNRSDHPRTHLTFSFLPVIG